MRSCGLSNRHVLGWQAVALNIWGNIIAFYALWFILPIYSKRCRNVWMTVLYSFELSLLVELLQLVFKVGSFDVDDLFLNTIGGLLGYLCTKDCFICGKDMKKQGI